VRSAGSIGSISALLATAALASLAGEPAARADGPAYELHADTDGPALAIGATFQASWLLRSQLDAPFCAPRCDPATLNALDRGVAGRWSPAWNRASDIGIATLLVAELTTLGAVDGLGAGAQDAVVIAEAVIWANGLGALTNFAVRRPRPFTYGDAAPLADRQDGNAALSFFSGHTTVAFAATTSLFVTLHRLRPKSPLPWIALAGFGLGAAFVGSTRMLAGYHFPTDVIAGAVIGTSLGFAIPALHGAPVSLAPLPDAAGRTAGVSVLGQF
jgi:membrane-associated phospholipid phosphatase